MSFLLRALRLLAMVVWVGGLVFFAFVEAPTAFHVMGTTGQFAQVIGGSVRALNRLGDAAGLIFLVATALLWLWSVTRVRRILVGQMLLAVAMMATTMYVQASILPAMEHDRATVGGDINSVPANNPARVDFDRLHELSEKLEGAVLFLGLGVVLLMSAGYERAGG